MLKKVENMRKCNKLNIFSERLHVKRSDKFFLQLMSPPPGKFYMDAHANNTPQLNID